MSSINPAGSIASQPRVAPVQPARTGGAPDPTAEKLAEQGRKLTATAAAAEVPRLSPSAGGLGLIIDFQV